MLKNEIVNLVVLIKEQMTSANKKLEIRECQFQLQVTEALASIRFPCTYFFEWKTANGKHHTASINRVKANQKVIPFNETVTMNPLLIYDLKQQKYRKKQSIIQVNLLSNSRPKDPKLVGRVALDLSAVANDLNPPQSKTIPLQYCSVDATITFKVSLVNQQSTSIDIANLDRSQFAQSQTILGEILTSGRQENKSQVLSSSSSAVRMSSKEIGSKISDMNIQDRLNRIRTEKNEISRCRTEYITSTKTVEEEQKIKTEKKIESTELNKGKSDNIAFPILTKNCSDFDSIRNSQNPMKKDISENVIKIYGQGPKQQKEVKIDNNIPLYQSHQKDMVKTDNIKVEVEKEEPQEQKGEENNDMIYTFGDRHQKTRELSCQEVEAKKKEFEEMILTKDREIQGLRSSERQLSLQINSLKYISEQYQNDKKALQEAQTQTQHLRGELMQIQIQMSDVKSHNDILQQKNKEMEICIQELQERIKVSQENYVSPTKNNENLEEITQLRLQLQKAEKRQNQLKGELEVVNVNYQEIHSQYQALLEENNRLSQQLEQLSQRNAQLSQQNNDNDLTILNQQLNIKEAQLKTLMDDINLLNETLRTKEKENDSIIEENATLLRQLSLSKRIENDLKERIQALGVQCEEKQLKLLEKDEDINMERYKMKELEEKSREAMQNGLKTSEKVLEDSKRRVEDLLTRMRQNEQRNAKLQRQMENYQSKLSQSDFAIEQYKEKIKLSEKERLQQFQTTKTLESELKQLKSKHQKETAYSMMEQTRIKQLLEQQTAKRKDLEVKIGQYEMKEKDNQVRMIELENKVSENMDKQQILKENLNVMENEINRISEMFQEKEEKEEQSAKIIIALDQNNAQLSIQVSDLENQLTFMNQRCLALESQVQLLNAYAPQQQTMPELTEINKKMAEKNKELLNQIQLKNQTISQLKKDIGESKINATKQELSNSRTIKENALLQEKIANLSQENEKLYQQFSKINAQYEEQMEAIEKGNQQRMDKLENQIDRLKAIIQEKQREISSLTVSKGKQEQTIDKEDQKFKEEIFRKQIKELNQENQSLNSKIEVLNSQYQSVCSELGDKQYQLYEALGKLKQAQDNLEQQKSNTKIESQQELNDNLKQTIEDYVIQNNKLSEKLTNKQKDMAQLERQFKIFKINSEELRRKISDNDLEFKKAEQKYHSTITELNNQLSKQTIHLKARDNDVSTLTQEKYQLQQKLQEIEKQWVLLKDEVELLKNKESGKSTPIQHFDQSPLSSMCKIDKIDINYTIEELSALLMKRKEQEEVEGVLRLVIDNNARGDEEFQRWNLQRGTIQQKAKMISREIQKVKAQVMKSQNRSIAQKSQITGMLRPVEKVINQLIGLSEALSEMGLQQGEDNDLEIEKEDV